MYFVWSVLILAYVYFSVDSQTQKVPNRGNTKRRLEYYLHMCMYLLAYSQGSAQKILSGGKSMCEIMQHLGDLELLWDALDTCETGPRDY